MKQKNGGHAPEHETRKPDIPLVAFDDIKLGVQRRYLIKGLIPRVGLTVVWGPPKCGKSFWTFDAMMHVALNWEYDSRRVHGGPVVYCAFEGQIGMQARAEAFRQRFLASETSRIPFFLVPVTLNLVRDHRRLIAAIKERLGTESPVAVALDTLNRSIPGSESSDEDMTAYIQAADVIRERFECAIPIVHHCGVDGTRPRGHTSLTGACEAQLSVARDRGDNVTVTVEHMKDGPDGETLSCRLEKVDVGFDEDGEAISSCVVVPIKLQQPAAKEPRLTKDQRTMFSILHDAGGFLSKEDWNSRARDAGLGRKRNADLFDLRSSLIAKNLVRENAEGFRVRHE